MTQEEIAEQIKQFVEYLEERGLHVHDMLVQDYLKWLVK